MIEILNTLLGRVGGDRKTGESPGAAFLRRRRERELEHEIRSRTVLGLVLSGMLLFVSFSRLYLNPTNYPTLFACFEVAGFLLLVVTLIVPQALAPIEAALRLLGAKIGEWALLCALGIVYLIVMTPIGLLIRTMRGADPIYQWSTDPPCQAEGWSTKSVTTVVRGKFGYAGSRTGVVGVISFFISRGKIVLLPAVTMLIAFGLAFYFVKTSVLAPFIYTLF